MPMRWRPPDAWSYALLLGLYLGDGCITDPGRTYQLRVHLDEKYPAIIEECVMAMTLTLLPRQVIVRDRPGCKAVEGSSQVWPIAFPQHGPGRKHLREIRLADWQQRIVDADPEPFLRGLIWSDGCRTINHFDTKLPSGRVATYEYPRYFFSNLSADIRGLFCASCDRLGIRWTQSNHRNISVSHRHSVAKLDSFVGPKA
jgi:hypothetical protein